MGQKINPIGLRLGIIKGWESSWYGGKDFSDKIVEDQKIRDYISLRIQKVVFPRLLSRERLSYWKSQYILLDLV